MDGIELAGNYAIDEKVIRAEQERKEQYSQGAIKLSQCIEREFNLTYLNKAGRYCSMYVTMQPNTKVRVKIGTIGDHFLFGLLWNDTKTSIKIRLSCVHYNNHCGHCEHFLNTCTVRGTIIDSRFSVPNISKKTGYPCRIKQCRKEYKKDAR